MAKTAHFGPSAGKTESTAATPPKFRSFYPLELFGLIHKRPGYDPFFAENPFSPADEFVFMGLVARSCHFDVTACAEARRLDNHHHNHCNIAAKTWFYLQSRDFLGEIFLGVKREPEKKKPDNITRPMDGQLYDMII